MREEKKWRKGNKSRRNKTIRKKRKGQKRRPDKTRSKERNQTGKR